MANILDLKTRQQIIAETLSEENTSRKEESVKRFEIWRERQSPFIIEKLETEFSSQTVQDMRKITSINLVPRIVDEEASLYKNSPKRTFSVEGKELPENQQKQLDALYDMAKANVKLQRGNKMYVLQNQSALQIIPKNGIIDIRILQPHHYDVIPKDDDPEMAECYIVSNFDKTRMFSQKEFNEIISTGRRQGDGINQQIADADDYKLRAVRMVWWTDTLNFVTNGKGQMINAQGAPVDNLAQSEVKNALGELPFIDIAGTKDFEFWVRAGNGVIDFALDFGVLLSDTANINRLQGYSQAIIYSEKPPTNMSIGPHKVMHIPQDKNSEIQAKFEFATPNPDMQASLDLLETYLRLFLSSKGIDPKTISGKAESQRFSSGIERLLAMIEKFEASRDDIDTFKSVEEKLVKLFIKWSNLFQGVTTATGNTKPLVPELKGTKLPEGVKIDVMFSKPEVIQTKMEREDSAIKMVDAGLMSRSEAISEIREVKEDKAIEILKKIDTEQVMLGTPTMTPITSETTTEKKQQDANVKGADAQT